MQVLLAGYYRDPRTGEIQDLRAHARYNLVQAGPPALDLAKAMAVRMAEEMPETAISRVGDLASIMVLLIEFGDPGRICVEELSRHRKANVRRAAAAAIGEAVDVAGVPTLERLLSSDEAWTVRAMAAEAAGRMGPARAKLGPALVDRLGKELDHAVVQRILRAIGDIRYEEAVPDLVRMAESPRASVSQAAIYALSRITGEKFVRVEDWREWYRTAYPAWKSRSRR